MTEGTGPTDRNEGSTEDSVSDAIDVDAIRSVLEDHSVRLGVLFGSQVDGTADPSSDVDVAVELDGSVADATTERLSLMADLSIELDRNAVDVALVAALAPRVGAIAMRDGVLLVGTPERKRALRERFEAAAADASPDESLRERYDAALESVDRIVEG